jgi:hypothetical protein
VIVVETIVLHAQSLNGYISMSMTLIHYMTKFQLIAQLMLLDAQLVKALATLFGMTDHSVYLKVNALLLTKCTSLETNSIILSRLVVSSHFLTI